MKLIFTVFLFFPLIIIFISNSALAREEGGKNTKSTEDKGVIQKANLHGEGRSGAEKVDQKTIISEEANINIQRRYTSDKTNSQWLPRGTGIIITGDRPVSGNNQGERVLKKEDSGATFGDSNRGGRLPGGSGVREEYGGKSGK